jgi:TetR/AcrR family transcriptional repressor of nem operon
MVTMTYDDRHVKPGSSSMRGERKAETRQKILDSAGSLFRRRGIDAVGVDAIMHEAGLTHGGFYAHFASKEALVAEVSAASLARAASRWERISQEAGGDAALARIVDAYLDPAHVAAAEQGCVLTTLGPEVARRSESRPAITAAIRRMADALARCLPGQRRRDALAMLSGMVGAVVLARLSDDPAFAEEVLAATRQAACSR